MSYMYRSKPETLRFQTIPPFHFSFTVPFSTGIGSFLYTNFMFSSYHSQISKKEKKTINSFLMGNLFNVIILETVGYPCNTSIENFPSKTLNLSKYT